MNDVVWVLGASDPEMEAIESLLRDAQQNIVYFSDGCSRVHPGNAYSVAMPPALLMGDHRIMLVECGANLDDPRVMRIDHHQPGDAGYGRKPMDFLAASSIGQVISFLTSSGVSSFNSMEQNKEPGDTPGTFVFRDNTWWIVENDLLHEVPHELVLTAAADHCLLHAYDNRCPGVEPDTLMQWRIRSRSKFQKRTIEEILSDVEAARRALWEAPTIVLGWECLCGDTNLPNGCGSDSVYSGIECDDSDPIEAVDMRGRHIPELPEASARERLCFIADGLPDRDGRIKIVCQSGSAEQVSAFMWDWAPCNGLVNIYGDPERGFAGGYLPAKS